MTNDVNSKFAINRRQVLKAGLGGATMLSGLNLSAAFAQSGDIVMGASQPITGVFAFAGVFLNQGMSDFCEWKNAKGGIGGRKLRYVSEDSGYKLDQSMSVFKKIVSSHQPPIYMGDSSGWAKAASQEVKETGKMLLSGPSFATELADPQNVPYYFMAGPTFLAQLKMLLKYVSDSAKGATKPSVALVYSDTEFGRDPIVGAREYAKTLGIPLVLEVVTKAGAVDVSTEVARLRRAKPDFVLFHGHVLAPIPEFIKQMRESGMTSRTLSTNWSMDKLNVDAMGDAAEGWTGIMPHVYSYETKDAPMIEELTAYARKTRPNVGYLSMFYTYSWFVGSIFAEVLERCVKAGKPLDGPNMKTALESIDNWNTGGFVGVPISMKSHQTGLGRVYQYDKGSKLLKPISDWINIT
jgi:branched-chain amino acid transport system substrate-binding protein